MDTVNQKAIRYAPTRSFILAGLLAKSNQTSRKRAGLAGMLVFQFLPSSPAQMLC
jgi:hypothetical protein